MTNSYHKNLGSKKQKIESNPDAIRAQFEAFQKAQMEQSAAAPPPVAVPPPIEGQFPFPGYSFFLFDI